MTDTDTPLPLPALLDDWAWHLKARGRAERTIVSYLHTGTVFVDFLARAGYPLDARQTTRAHIEAFLVDVRERTSPANEAKHYRSLQQLWRWLVDVEEELPVSPMAKLTPPVVPEKPVPVITDEKLAALLAACSGKDFNSRRDAAMIRLLLDTGMRAGELLGLTLDGTDELGRPTGLDLQYGLAHVIGKGDRPRACQFGPKTGDALRRYLRARALHRDARSDALWLGRRGPLCHDGLAQLLELRCRQAGIEPINPHRFRHTAAHAWLVAGGQEVDLMRLMGWRSREMVARYGASAADQRAHEAHRRLSLGERI